MSYFVYEIIKMQITSSDSATHFAIQKNGKLRYLIDLKAKKLGCLKLVNNLSIYSGKLRLLTYVIKLLPLKLLNLLKIGRFVKVDLCSGTQEILEQIWREKYPETDPFWNVIVGSYVEKQKVVFQCFSINTSADVFIKVGGSKVRTEMNNEINYLKRPIIAESFMNPVMIFGANIDSEKLTVLATEEFGGEKVAPVMTEEIYRIFKSVTAIQLTEDTKGNMYCFSHGDFTPWNIKKTDNSYIVFDWEYSSVRFYGFDLIHYFWQVENKLKKKGVENSMQVAITEAKKWDVALQRYSDDYLAEMYYKELRKQFGDTL